MTLATRCRWSLLLAIVAALAVLSSNAHAQKQKIDEAKLRSQIEEGLGKIADNQRERFYNFMTVKVAEITRTVQLTDAQKRKLDVAAKGTAERFLEKWKAVAITWILQITKQQPNQQAAEQIAKQWTREEMFKQYNTMLDAGTVTRVMTRTPVWNRMLQSTLTPEQFQTFRDAEAAREASSREASFNYLLMVMDRELLLSANQKEKLRPIILKTLGEKFNDGYASSIQGTFWLSVQIYKIPSADVQVVLDKPQMKVWLGRVKAMSMYFQMGPAQSLGPWAPLLLDDVKAAGNGNANFAAQALAEDEVEEVNDFDVEDRRRQ